MFSPEIIQLGPLSLRWYGVCAALAALACYVLLLKRASKFGLTQSGAADLLMAAVIAGVIGARLEYIRRFWAAYYSQDFWGIFRIWEGGLVFQGGFILAVVVVLLQCHYRHWQVSAVADLLAPAVPVGHAIARVGCLLNGCCFGIPWRHWGGIAYPSGVNDVLHTQITKGIVTADATAACPVFPVQGLEALLCLAIAGLLFWMERRHWCDGRRFLLYVLWYSIGRFFLEFLRGDYPQAGGLTPAQLTTLFVVLPVTIAILAWLTWRTHRTLPKQ